MEKQIEFKDKNKSVEKLKKLFDDIQKKQENFKDAVPVIEKLLATGQLDKQEVSGVIPSIATTKKIKQLKLKKERKLPKQPDLPKYKKEATSAKQKVAYKKIMESKKAFDKKIGKAFAQYLIKPASELI